MTQHPEKLDTDHQALVSPVLQDVLAASFADELNYGTAEYTDGVSPDWRDARDAAIERYRQLHAAGATTHTDLLISQVFIAATAPDPESLYRRVVTLAAYAVDWAEDLAERGYRVEDDCECVELDEDDDQ